MSHGDTNKSTSQAPGDVEPVGNDDEPPAGDKASDGVEPTDSAGNEPFLPRRMKSRPANFTADSEPDTETSAEPTTSEEPVRPRINIPAREPQPAPQPIPRTEPAAADRPEFAGGPAAEGAAQVDQLPDSGTPRSDSHTTPPSEPTRRTSRKSTAPKAPQPNSEARKYKSRAISFTPDDRAWFRTQAEEGGVPHRVLLLDLVATYHDQVEPLAETTREKLGLVPDQRQVRTVSTISMKISMKEDEFELLKERAVQKRLTQSLYVAELIGAARRLGGVISSDQLSGNRDRM